MIKTYLHQKPHSTQQEYQSKLPKIPVNSLNSDSVDPASNHTITK